MKIESHFRQLNTREAEIITRLLTANFLGKEEIAAQMENCRVRTIDDEGSLEIEVENVARVAAVQKRIPVEADATDEDGIRIHLLLHVVEGLAKELEIYKDNGSPIKRPPNAEDLDIIVFPA